MMIKTKHDGISIVITILLALALLPPSIPSSDIEREIAGTPTGWTDDIRLTNHEGSDANPSISTYQENVHVVWRNIWGGDARVYYSNSTDGGQTWSNRKQLGTGINSDFPDIATNKTNLHVVYHDNIGVSNYEIAYCNSTDGGITWNPSKMISVDDGWNSQYAKIAVNGSELHVVWTDSRFYVSPNWNTELYYVRSIDGGITWDDGLGNIGEERRLTNAIYESCEQRIAVNGDVIHMIWCDMRNGVTTGDIYYKRSLDKGSTWDDGLGNVDLDRRLTDNSTNHGPAALTVSGSTIHVAWVDEVWPGPNYYIYYRKSIDNGTTWEPIKLLVGPFPGSDYRPTLASYGNTVHMTWMDMRDDGLTREIYYKNSTDGGESWNQDLRLTNSTGSNSWWPVLDVNGSQVHVTWYDERDGNREIYYKRYPDFSPDLSPPIPSNETPPPDTYKDAPGTNVSVHVTDPSGVNESTIQLYVNSSIVSHNLSPITDGYNVSYVSPGFDPGVITCRIVTEDNYGNQLDYTWNFTVLATYKSQLREGWNLISVPFVQVNTSIKEVLRDIDGKWDCIEYYDAESGEWKSYATFWLESLNEFQEINNTMAIWINITEPDVNLTSRGIISTNTEIPLKAGWNFVGYPTQTLETVGNALWGTGADRVEVFDSSDPYRLKEVGPTYVMKPGEGYWVRVVSDTVWFVGW